MKPLFRSGPLARFFLLIVVVSLAACASGRSGESALRPGVQRLPTLRAQGDLIIATLPGATVTVEPLTPKGLEAYYTRRTTLPDPFKIFPRRTKGLLAFILRIQNVGQDRINFDPGQAALVDQQDRRLAAISYDELYSLFSEKGESAKVLRVFEETVLTSYIVVPPKLDREGLLLFPSLDPAAKAVILELGSFYIGSAEQLLLFEFEIRRGP
ncbi:hypothetical protein MELA_02573 [Candidatus Methylomirabilis lanthanidiphila]|uniref:Lipoprotein n=1 Tax=Candidatus Methylomirabilis lanthanidiphila TaxID=2211376 RepID=A0A564ZM55_9BACT|nr:hypothetical protein [Candidatus Methylomirabilis lanthanidiphila]VUZ86176.1 hypothetical protein MELA_02573 [Candidatus Methylomirabilis lanthanidiphila]